MMTIYSYFLFPIFRFALFLSSVCIPKIRIGLKERKSEPWLKTPNNEQPIIIHCSSGEFEYAKPVIREIKKQNPNQKVYVTYFSPTYRKVIESTPGVDFCFPLPWESPSTLKAWFDHQNPKALLIARTDIWPGLLSECKKRNLPTALFSATLSSRSSRLKNPISRIFATWTLKNVDHIYCVTNEDKKNFEQLGCGGKTEVLGDTRFDQVVFRIQNPKSLKENLKPKNTQRTVICGSTWPEDEKVLIPVIKKLKNEYQFIIAPHEPSESHLGHLESILSDQKISYELYSKASQFSAQVLIIDQVGILADLYKWASFAFVGGSFRKTVHSVMEPLASSCITLFGPFHHNNREALLFKGLKSRNRLPLACEVGSEEDFVRIIKMFENSDIKMQQHEVLAALQSYTGATQRLLERQHF